MAKFTRSSTDKKIAGVCGGLGEHFNFDPLILRVIFATALLVWGTGGLLYILLWIFAPLDTNV